MGAVVETAIVDYLCRPRKTNFCFLFPLAANKRKFAVFVFRLQQNNGGCHFPLVQFSACETGNMETWRWSMETWIHRKETWKHGEMETWRHGEMETWT
jgi:hypothetical protein